MAPKTDGRGAVDRRSRREGRQAEPPSKMPAQDTVRGRWGYLVRLLRLFYELSPQGMAANAAVTLVTGLAPLLSLFALRHLVDAATRAAGQGGTGLAGALGWAAVLVAAMALEGSVWRAASLVRDRIQEEMKTRIQARIIAKAQRLPLGAFEQAEYYDQLQRIERGLDQRFFSTMAFVFRLGNHLITLVALILYVGAAHWSLPLILTAGTALFLMFRIRILREKYILERSLTERERRLLYLGTLMTGREAAAEIRLFGLGDHLLEYWSRLFRELREIRLRLHRREFRAEGASSSGQALTFGVALLVVVYQVGHGALTVGQYAAFVGAVQQFQESMYALFWDTALVDNDLRYIRDFFLYLELPGETTDDRPPAIEQPRTEECKRYSEPFLSRRSSVVGRLHQAIVFEGVSFAYPGSDRRVLDNVQLHIQPGERIALVGENGAGKTTLAKLLLGLYRPTEGRVLVDGVDMADIDPASWRKRAAAVFQDFVQYHTTVRENIVFGSLERQEDEPAITRAAQLAGADAVAVALPRGWDTLLGKAYEEGAELSLGQWQKIAAARAYLRDAEVLVLDEPTAALDAKAEVAVYRQFRDASQGRTVLLISHRLGSARLADRILVLAAGRIVEEGTHAELMQRGGLYHRMLGAQAQWYT